MAEFTTEGGGVHPGKPVIWPTGKTTPTVSSPPPARTAPTRPGEVAPTPQVPTAPGAAPARPTPMITRPLTLEDLRAHLLSLQIDPNDFNTKLASLMLRNGLELSRINFVKILTMLEGTNRSSALQEAALILLMKNIDSPEAVRVLGHYLSENPGMAAQILALQEARGNLATALGMGKALLDTTLIAQLTALLSQFDDIFRRFTKNLTEGKGTSRLQLLNEVRALKSLLAGLQEKSPVADSAEAQVLSTRLSEFQGRLEGLLQNLLAQVLLSQNGRSQVNYLFQQVPNAFTAPLKDLEMVVKRNGQGKEAVVDPSNTQIVMSMETENLGKMVVSLIIKNNKIYVIFVFAEKDYGNQGRGLIAKEFGDLQKKLSDRNYLITGYQVKVDPVMCNIRAYLFPLLPHLDDLLRRIDIEA